MSRLGFKSVVYHGDLRLGELDAIPVSDQNFQFPNNEIRIHHVSPPSERCPPLSILQTISSFSVRCKLESSLMVEQLQLINLHAMCFYELKVTTQSTSFQILIHQLFLFLSPRMLQKFDFFFLLRYVVISWTKKS